MGRTFEAGAALRPGFFAQEPPRAGTAPAGQAGRATRAGAAIVASFRRCCVQVGFDPLAFAAPVAKAVAGAIQTRCAFVCTSGRASGSARHAALERATAAPTTAIGSAQLNAVTIKAASLPARTAGAAAFELTGTALPMCVVKRRQSRIAGKGHHKPEQEESQNSEHRALMVGATERPIKPYSLSLSV
ncbi:hypothetical protein [Ruegeria sp. HKCCA5763]|uniref:hypothetical protein n=1 Tax=Ruegeria sp. HKCCA5763 TaxID=2682987 RepID=UPI0014891EB7|nr:hypothetical protein [Ruegeria sp. HKCCA5763]